MSELKPCPFCGGEVEVGAGYWDRHGTEYEVSCGNPQCLVHPYGDLYDTEAEAIEAWNTRAERTCHAELNEDRNAITCSECGSTMILKGWEEFHDWTGTTRISTFTTYPHCPNCGAKVVSE